MNIHPSSETRFSVAVLEDTIPELKSICEELEERGLARCVPCSEFRELLRKLDSNGHVAVSLDWELQSSFPGRRILQQLKSKFPEVARVVFTKHKRARVEALSSGADAFFAKKSTQDEYIEGMARGIELGAARHVLRELAKHGVDCPTPSDLAFPLENGIKAEIRRKAERVVLIHLVDMRDTEVAYLRSLLVGLGWWQAFDLPSYTRLPWGPKLAHLLELFDISNRQAADILATDENLMQDLLAASERREVADTSIAEAADQLLSVLAYVLRIASNDPQIARFYFDTTGLYGAHPNSPPWDDMGMRKFLCAGRSVSARQCLQWCREH